MELTDVPSNIKKELRLLEALKVRIKKAGLFKILVAYPTKKLGWSSTATYLEYAVKPSSYERWVDALVARSNLVHKDLKYASRLSQLSRSWERYLIKEGIIEKEVTDETTTN